MRAAGPPPFMVRKLLQAWKQEAGCLRGSVIRGPDSTLEVRPGSPALGARGPWLLRTRLWGWALGSEPCVSGGARCNPGQPVRNPRGGSACATKEQTCELGPRVHWGGAGRPLSREGSACGDRSGSGGGQCLLSRGGGGCLLWGPQGRGSVPGARALKAIQGRSGPMKPRMWGPLWICTNRAI